MQIVKSRGGINEKNIHRINRNGTVQRPRFIGLRSREVKLKCILAIYLWKT